MTTDAGLKQPASATTSRSLWLAAMPGVFVVLWSTGFIGAKFGLPYIEPLTFLGIRFAIVARSYNDNLTGGINQAYAVFGEDRNAPDQRLRQVYADLARQHGVALVPFFLEGVALQPGLMQSDGLHPTAAAQPRLLENAWPLLEPLL